jgi:hypothetical protein
VWDASGYRRSSRRGTFDEAGEAEESVQERVYVLDCIRTSTHTHAHPLINSIMLAQEYVQGIIGRGTTKKWGWERAQKLECRSEQVDQVYMYTRRTPRSALSSLNLLLRTLKSTRDDSLLTH